MAIYIGQLESLGPLKPEIQLDCEVEAGGTLIGSTSESRGVVAPVKRHWGNHNMLVKSVSARWALLSTKISSFPPEIPRVNPRISGRKEKILGSVFILKRAHRAETEFTKI